MNWFLKATLSIVITAAVMGIFAAVACYQFKPFMVLMTGQILFNAINNGMSK